MRHIVTFAVLNQNHPPQQYYETDSSDEDEEDDDEVPQTVHKTYSNASSGRSSRLSRKKSMSETTDTRAQYHRREEDRQTPIILEKALEGEVPRLGTLTVEEDSREY